MPLTDSASIAAPRHAPNEEAMRERGGRIRLVFVIDNMLLGGTELNAVRTAERLDRNRFDLSVVCLSGEGPLTERYAALGVPVVSLALRSFHGMSMLAGGIRFIRYLRAERADIVHGHDIYSNAFVAVWARFATVPVVIASQRWHLSPNAKLRLINRLAFSRADAVLANSTQVARIVSEEERVPSTKIWTITNFADDAAFELPSEKERARRRVEWGASASTVVLGCVARFDPVKDHAGLLRAFAKLRAIHPDVLLVLVGDGASRSMLEALVAELGLNDAVHFTGELPGGRNHHFGFDISVLASISEGFPNSLVEAMAAGNPVVATAVGGNFDAVLDGITGLLVPSSDAAALAEALSRLVASAALRSALGGQGRRRAQEEYRSSSVVSSLEEMYRHLLVQRER